MISRVGVGVKQRIGVVFFGHNHNGDKSILHICNAYKKCIKKLQVSNELVYTTTIHPSRKRVALVRSSVWP